MIELTDTLIQMVMMAITSAIAFYKALFDKNTAEKADDGREWILLGLFSGQYFLEDIFYELNQLFYDSNPGYFLSDLPMYMSYLFLILLMSSLEKEKKTVKKRMLSPWLLIPVFTFTMAVIFYLRNGDPIGNIVCFVIMTIAIRMAVSGILREKDKNRNKQIVYVHCFIVLALEYALWISSSFYWPGDTLKNPYFWIDVLFSISMPCFIPILGKAVKQ